MATIVKCKTLKGDIRYKAQVRTESGFVSQTFSRLALATAWARKTEGDIEAGMASPTRASRTHTVGELIDKYLASTECPVKSRSTTEIRCAWWRERLGSMRLSQLSKSRIREELDAKAEDCGPATVNRQLSQIRKLLNYAISIEWLTLNVCVGIKDRPEPKERTRVIQPGEFDRLLTAARSLAATAPARTADAMLPEFLIMTYATGMRRGEVARLKWSDVHADKIVLRDSKSGKGRIVPLNNDASAALAAIRGDAHDGYVFANVRGKPITPNAAQKRARTLAGLGADENGEHLVLHTLRHSFATEVAAGGASMAQLMSATGHLTPATAMRYVHAQEEMAQAAHALRRAVS